MVYPLERTVPSLLPSHPAARMRVHRMEILLLLRLLDATHA
jgi:hypothetical protein